MNEINLFNYYIENNYINLNNNITEEEIYKLLNFTIKMNFTIDNCTIPNDFKFINILEKYYPNLKYNII